MKVASEIGKIIVAKDACTAAAVLRRAAACRDDEYKTQVYTVCYLSILRRLVPLAMLL